MIQTKNGYARQVMTVKCIHYLSADEQFLFLLFSYVFVLFSVETEKKNTIAVNLTTINDAVAVAIIIVDRVFMRLLEVNSPNGI